VASACDAVTRGDSLAAAFADKRLIAPSVQEAILSGERSGQLGPLLTTLADFLEENNEVTVRSLTSILEPLILVALGLLVGIIAVSMFLPLFDLTAATRGGG
jgi:type II secretory pathway component PulF